MRASGPQGVTALYAALKLPTADGLQMDCCSGGVGEPVIQAQKGPSPDNYSAPAFPLSFGSLLPSCSVRRTLVV